ncbi:MAG: zinc-ribbon domain-containing protein [Methylibium sp.]|nr:zinc-ribbon domain-containing protein [Methylibium sp.]
MTLATRCTACGTIFRVVQDQLKVSEGWVRCGRCQEVFNALESLFDLEREAPPQRLIRPAAPSATEVAARAVEEFIASQQPPLGASPQDEVPATHEDDAIESRFFSKPLQNEARSDDADSEHPDFADARFPSEFPLDAVLDDDAGTSRPEPAEAAPKEPSVSLRQRWRERHAHREREKMSSLFETSIDDTPANPGPSTSVLYELPPGVAPGFVRQAEDAARWQRPRVRASLVVAGLLLLGVLSVQVAVQFRDTIAAHRPDARPALEALCDVMGCNIGPLRRLAALTVEASGLTQVEGSSAYRLSLSLNNRGSVAVAPPTIELGLTDSSGALIARRALLPSDFRVSSGGGSIGAMQALAPGTETQWQALLSTGDARVSGYTVELFYP